MLGIIVPYRDRETHLKLFVPYMHTYLDMQNIDHKIYIVEQADNKLFNRGKLLNIGYKLAQSECKYFAFHDIDMLPITADYSEPTEPTHLVCDASQFEGGIPYENYFGGVVLLNANDYEAINGFSNDYWGWGSEDDDLLLRLFAEDIKTIRRNGGVFKSLEHEYTIVPEASQKNYERLISKPNYKLDGLTTLEYELLHARQINERAIMYSVLI